MSLPFRRQIWKPCHLPASQDQFHGILIAGLLSATPTSLEAPRGQGPYLMQLCVPEAQDRV